jgi:hypothetical protein
MENIYSLIKYINISKTIDQFVEELHFVKDQR